MEFFFYKCRSLHAEYGSQVLINFTTDKGKIFETIGEEDVNKCVGYMQVG
jgi:hypothetical protein